jgi:siroheme synthase
MGVRTLSGYCAHLIAHGMPPDTPALMVERASHADQRNIAGTISTLPGLVAAAGVKGPALTIVGAIVRERSETAS